MERFVLCGSLLDVPCRFLLGYKVPEPFFKMLFPLTKSLPASETLSEPMQHPIVSLPHTNSKGICSHWKARLNS